MRRCLTWITGWQCLQRQYRAPGLRSHGDAPGSCFGHRATASLALENIGQRAMRCANSLSPALMGAFLLRQPPVL